MLDINEFQETTFARNSSYQIVDGVDGLDEIDRNNSNSLNES